MAPFVPPARFVIHETEHWLVNHRIDTVYPGYLMVGARAPDATSFASLSPEALAELGGLLAACVHALETRLGATRVYCGRYGHEPDHTVHFHVLPVYAWTVERFLADELAPKLRSFHASPPDAASPTLSDFDGADLTLFLWRRFADPGAVSPEIDGPSMDEPIEVLRAAFRSHTSPSSAP